MAPRAAQVSNESPDRLRARRARARGRANRRRGEETAERILDAAEGLFAERGYAGATLRDVAAAVGIRNPSLYNHFPSKESLYSAVLERGMRPVFAVLSEFLDAEAPAYRDSEQVIRRVNALLAERPDLPRLILHETLGGGQRMTPMLREWIGPTFVRAREMVEATPGIRRWEPEQIPNLVLAMYHVVIGYFTVAPLYRELSGEDLLAHGAVARQTRFLAGLVDVLFPEEPDDAQR